MKQNFKFIVAFAIGIIAGFGILLILPFMPLPVNNPLLRAVGIKKQQIVGFLPYFLAYRATHDYNPSITTLTYFGFTVNNDGHIVKLINPHQEDSGWYDLKTKQIQQKLKDAKANNIVLSVSVVQANEASISALIASPTKHALNLVSDLLPVMDQYHFEDVNVDIESFKTATASDSSRFTTFIKTFTEAIHKKNGATVTFDIAPIAFIKQTAINPIEIGEIVDYVLVMGYDFHTATSSNTGPIAPLYGEGISNEFDISHAITLAKQEISSEKLILALPLYGYEWDSLSSTPAAATIPDTGQTASNRRIMQTFTTSCQTCLVIEDPLSQEKDFIYQEKKGDAYYHHAFLFDKNSFAKRLTFAQNQKLAGVGLWALGYEGDTILLPLTSYKGLYHFE